MVARDLFEQLTMVFQYLSFLDAKTVFMVGYKVFSSSLEERTDVTIYHNLQRLERLGLKQLG